VQLSIVTVANEIGPLVKHVLNGFVGEASFEYFADITRQPDG